MKRSRKKLPQDSNQRAKAIADLSTEQPSDGIREYLSAIGTRGGKKGGKVRAQKLSDERRSEIARMGGLAKGEHHRKKIIAKEDSSQSH